MKNFWIIFASFLLLSGCGCNSCSKKTTPQGTNEKGEKLKILFDASKAEMVGNADWVIDADVFDIGYNNTGRMMEGRGEEADPQRYPTPDQSTVTADTKEDFWTGGLSAWALDCVKEGYFVETLPVRGRITYGDAGNEQDLSHYKVYVVDEPNIRFEPEEKKALLAFVENGGGLFMIADHDGSDRNKDKWDSPKIWNDINSASTFPMEFDYVEISQVSNHFATDSHPVLDGKYGRPKQLKFSSGTSMHLRTGATPLSSASKQG